MSGAGVRSVRPAGARSLVLGLLPLGLGLAALGAGTLVGWDARWVGALVTPPPIIRAALVGIAAVAGLAMLLAGLRRMGMDAAPPAPGDPGLGLHAMVRGVRLVFLALAAFAAAGGWLVGHPLPIVAALVIAGVDLVETSFLLLVSRRRERR